MAILHVASLGQPILRRVAAPVGTDQIRSPGFQSFLDNLLESMHFHRGVGLAAPQVFSPWRVVAVYVPAEMDEAGAGLAPAVFINPEVKPEGHRIEHGWEGCLSLKDLRGLVPRHHSVELRALDRNGSPVETSLHGFPARVIQHEVDHLDGIVFPDRMPSLDSLCFEKEMESHPPEDESESG